MQLSQLRTAAKGRYGRIYDTSADPLFTDALLNELINQAHRNLAAETRCYRNTQTYDLPVGVAGLSTVPLDCGIIEVIDGTLRANLNSVWTPLRYVEERELWSDFGAFEQQQNGTPFCYFMRSGATLDGQRVAELFYGSDTLVTGGVKLAAYVYPSLMSADTDTPALQPAEHTRLLSWVCLEMAKLEQARGRTDAPVPTWERAAQADGLALRDLIDRSRESGTRRIQFTPDAHY